MSWGQKTCQIKEAKIVKLKWINLGNVLTRNACPAKGHSNIYSRTRFKHSFETIKFQKNIWTSSFDYDRRADEKHIHVIMIILLYILSFLHN